MGNGMSKTLPGLYVGNFRDAKDADQLKENKITHILSIHDNAKPLHNDKKYLCIIASDTPDQELSQFFPQCIEFIHQARADKGHVLVHCLAGVSRSVTVTAAYIMTVTDLGWKDSLNAIRGARTCANPNFGFQKQLQQYEVKALRRERERIKKSFPRSPYDDIEETKRLLEAFQRFVLYGDPKEKDDGLYPLPPNAYRDKKVSPNRIAVKTKEASTEKSNAQAQKTQVKADANNQQKNAQSESSSDKIQNQDEDRKKEVDSTTTEEGKKEEDVRTEPEQFLFDEEVDSPKSNV